MTPARQAGARGVAKVTSGVQYDPAGTFVNVRVTSDHRADRAHDAPAGIDVVSAAFARNDDLRRVVLTHAMFGTVPKQGAVKDRPPPRPRRGRRDRRFAQRPGLPHSP